MFLGEKDSHVVRKYSGVLLLLGVGKSSFGEVGGTPFKLITSSVLHFYIYSLVDISKQWAILGTGFRTALPSKADLVANNRRTTQKFSQL